MLTERALGITEEVEATVAADADVEVADGVDESRGRQREGREQGMTENAAKDETVSTTTAGARQPQDP